MQNKYYDAENTNQTNYNERVTLDILVCVRHSTKYRIELLEVMQVLKKVMQNFGYSRRLGKKKKEYLYQMINQT